MQKLVAKYGTAAHLALLAVAPLFLFPFCKPDAIATVMVWLSAVGFGWLFLEPSLRDGEMPHHARERVVGSVVRDPLFWTLVVLTLYAGLRALNTGIGLSYDAEAAAWSAGEARFSILPCSKGGSGYLPFAATVALAAVVLGCRHALGRSARMVFLLVSSALAGLAAVVMIVMIVFQDAGVLSLITCRPEDASFVGMAFGIHLLGGTVAICAAFERRWNLAMVLSAPAVGGTAAGLFIFAPALVSVVFAGVELLVLGYTFFFAGRVLKSVGEFKMLVVIGISFTLGVLLVMAVLPEKTLAEKVAPYLSQEFLPESVRKLRAVLSGVSFRSWVSNLWIGTGVGSFALDFRFNATAEDWALLPRGAATALNGWWTLLAERGIVGLLALLLPLGFLLFTYVRRLVQAVLSRRLPHPACWLAPLAVAAAVAMGFFDCSFLRADVLVMGGALFAVSANSFPRMMRVDNG